MPDSQANAQLDIKVDARQLNFLQRLLEKIFGRETPRAFNTEVARVNEALKDNVKTTTNLVEALGKVRKGTDAYKELVGQLREATKESKELQRALDTVSSASARIARASAGAGGGGGGGGVGGATPGGWGWGQQRGIPNVQAPMPGLGAMTTTLGAIPVLGAMAAGSLMAAAGTYSSALQFQQARLEATPYMMRAADILRYQGARAEETTQVAAGGPSMTTLQRLMRKEVAGRPGGGKAVWGLGVSDEEYADKLVEGALTGAFKGGGMQTMEGLTGAGRTETIVTRAAKAADKTFSTAGITRLGIQFGYAPSAALQMAGGMGAAAMRPVSDREIGAAMMMQRGFGVSGEQMGAAMYALRSTGNKGDVQEVADLIGQAVSLELESSQIQTELSAMTGFLSQQAQKGVKFDVMGLRSIQTSLAAVGIENWRVGDISRQFAGGVSEIGYAGVQGPVQQRLLEAQFRAMGKAGPTTIEDYSEALFRMQSGADIAKVLPEFLRSFELEGRGQTPFFQARMFQQAIGQIGGTRIGPEEAMRISAEALRAGPGGAVTFDIDQAMKSVQELVSQQGGLLQAEAGLEAERVKVGHEVAGAMIDLQRTTLHMAETFTNTFGPALDITAKKAEELSAKLVEVTEGLDILKLYGIGGIRP